MNHRQLIAGTALATLFAVSPTLAQTTQVADAAPMLEEIIVMAVARPARCRV